MPIKQNAVQVDTLNGQFTLPDFTRQLPAILALKRETPIRQATLQNLHNELLEPFLNNITPGGETDSMTAKVVAVGSTEATIAWRVLTYGYCSHYFTGKGTPYLPGEASNPHFQAYTLVATWDCCQTPLVLATLQATVGTTAPALALFTPVSGAMLPHLVCATGQTSNGLIGELRRFSVNPLFEAIPLLSEDPLKAVLREYRSLLYGELYQLALRTFCAMKIDFVYGIATPEIYRFFTKSGITMMHQLQEMVLTENDEVALLQQEFADYWRPHAPLAQQPALYQVDLPAHNRA